MKGRDYMRSGVQGRFPGKSPACLPGRSARRSVIILAALAALALASGCETPAGGIIPLSITNSFAVANNSSRIPSISANAERTAFSSAATDLVASDTNGFDDIFLRDLSADSTTMVSTSLGGIQGNNASRNASISANGDRVAFQSWANNLASDDAGAICDIFVKALAPGYVYFVSTSSSGARGNGDSETPSISSTGTYVAFSSNATNFVSGDTNGDPDIYVKNTSNGLIERVSTSSFGAQGNGSAYTPRISTDGMMIIFESDASNLVSGDTNGLSDIFMKNRYTNETTRISTSAFGAQGDGESHEAWITPNGRYVTFMSDSTDLISGDTNASYDVFIKDTSNGSLSRVSESATGDAADGHSVNPSLSTDGRYVAFASFATDLVPGDTNASPDVFVKDRFDGSIDRPSVTASGVQALGGPSGSPVLSSDGHFVAFESLATNLMGADSNGVSDIYLADTDFQGPNPPTGITSTPPLNGWTNTPLLHVGWSAITDDFTDPDDLSTLFSGVADDVPDTTEDADAAITEATSDALADGVWYFHLRGKDDIGNWSGATHYGPLGIDRVKPTVAFKTNAKKSGAYLMGKVAFPIAATDDRSGVAKVSMIVGGKVRGFTDTRSPYAPVVRTTKLANGKRTFTARAYDRAGNTRDASRTYRVDNYKPRTYVKGSAKRAVKVKKGKYVRLYYKVKDPYTSTAYVKIKIKTLKGKTKKTIKIGWKKPGTFKYYRYKAKLPRGKYRYFVYATDKAGNTQNNVAKKRLTIR